MLLSKLFDDLYDGVLNLGRKKLWFLILTALFLTVIFINGIAIVPQEPYQMLSQNPFITRTDIHFNNYWQENPLLPIIAFFLNLTSPLTFNILCFVIIVGAFTLFAWLTFTRLDSAQALIFSTLLLTSPLTTVLLSWVGTPDGLTLVLTIPFLFTHASLLMFFLGILGMVNHPSFMFAAIEILILRWAAKDGVKVKHLTLTLLGITVGYGLVKFFLITNGIEVLSRADFMLTKDLGGWLKLNVANLPMSIFSLFNIHWLILVICLIMFFKTNKRFYTLVLLALLVNYGITFFTLDTTRIFSLLSWGVLFECIFHSYKLATSGENKDSPYQKQFLQALIVIGLISFVTPRYFLWAGEIHTTPFYEFMRKAFHLLT